MIALGDIPADWTYDAEGWFRPGGVMHCARAGLHAEDGALWARAYGPTRTTPEEAEEDLLRMVWALQDGYDPRALHAEVTRLEVSDAANERRWRNEERAKHQIMAYRDDERARADAADQEVATLRDRLERTEAALTYDRERLAAQTIMLREQQRVIDHLRRGLLRRVIGWVRG